MELVRKDIECYFGRLKQRFRMLRVPNLLTDKEKIDNMMFSIVSIQNMVHDYVIAADEMRSWSVFQTPVDFGWDVQHVSESEKEGFRMRQQMLVKNYE